MNKRLPVVTPRQVMSILAKKGFVIDRSSGSHHLFRHPDKPKVRVIVSYHNKDIKQAP